LANFKIREKKINLKPQEGSPQSHGQTREKMEPEPFQEVAESIEREN